MKKSLIVFVLATLVAVPSFATYIVVLKNGTRYQAKAKWTVVNGKAIVQLENGQSLSLDPSLIDNAQSEQATKSGIAANANVIDLNPTQTQATKAASEQQTSIGSIKLRRPTDAKPATAPTTAPAPTSNVPTLPGTVPADVIDKFQRAYENVGIFEQKVTATGGRSLRAELTVDTEERVFYAISATSFLISRNAGVEGAQIDMVELYMKTTTGGAAGRFQMSRADAEALDKKTISQQDYFVRKVIY